MGISNNEAHFRPTLCTLCSVILLAIHINLFTHCCISFQLPSIEVIVKSPAPGRDQKRPPILALVICPTRELATQAAAEASTLLKYHPSVGVQVVIGGTRLALEQKRMQTNPCQVNKPYTSFTIQFGCSLISSRYVMSRYLGFSSFFSPLELFYYLCVDSCSYTGKAQRPY